jgi:hypothetical protein
VNGGGEEKNTYSVGPLTRKHSQLPKRRDFKFLMFNILLFGRWMKSINPSAQCYTPSSKPFRVFFIPFLVVRIFFINMALNKTPSNHIMEDGVRGECSTEVI